jgi:Na+/proline symporter
MGLVLGTLVIQDPGFSNLINDTFAANDGSLKSKTDLMVPIFILNYLPHGVIGVLFVAILSAAMSSLSSAINSLSAVTVEDFIKRMKPDISAVTYMQYSKGASIFWGLICLICAFFVGDIADTVIEAINKIGSVFYGPILAAFGLAILTRRANATGVNVGIVVGVAVNIFLWTSVPEVFWFWWNAIGAAVTGGLGYLISLLIPAKSDFGMVKMTDIDWARSAPKLIGLFVFFVFIVIFCLALPTFFAT